MANKSDTGTRPFHKDEFFLQPEGHENSACRMEENEDHLFITIPGLEKGGLEFRCSGYTLYIHKRHKESRSPAPHYEFYSPAAPEGADLLYSLRLPCRIRRREISASSKDGDLLIKLIKYKD